MRAQNVGARNRESEEGGFWEGVGGRIGGRGGFGACRGWICSEKAGLEEDSWSFWWRENWKGGFR